MKPIFKRSEHNSILSANDLPFHAETVFNPAAADTCVCLAWYGWIEFWGTLETGSGPFEIH